MLFLLMGLVGSFTFVNARYDDYLNAAVWLTISALPTLFMMYVTRYRLLAAHYVQRRVIYVVLLRMFVFRLSACECADSAISQINLFSSNRICSGVPSLCSHCTHNLMLIVLCYFHPCSVTLVVVSSF